MFLSYFELPKESVTEEVLYWTLMDTLVWGQPNIHLFAGKDALNQPLKMLLFISCLKCRNLYEKSLGKRWFIIKTAQSLAYFVKCSYCDVCKFEVLHLNLVDWITLVKTLNYHTRTFSTRATLPEIHE